MTSVALRDEAILELWATSLSATEIQNRMALRSRSVVLGVVNRARKRGDKRASLRDAETRSLNQSRAAKAIVRPRVEPIERWASQPPADDRPRRVKVDKKGQKLLAKFEQQSVGRNAVSIANVKRWQCRFPVQGRGASMLMCGDPVATLSKPYCACHRTIVYRVARIAEEEA